MSTFNICGILVVFGALLVIYVQEIHSYTFSNSYRSTLRDILVVNPDGSLASFCGWCDLEGRAPPLGNNVSSLFSSRNAYVAHLKNNSVYLLDGIRKPFSLDNVRKIVAGNYGFAALRYDGTLVSWGGRNYYKAYVYKAENVKDITTNGEAFASIMEDGTVRAWGENRYGGSVFQGKGRDNNRDWYGAPQDLTDVKAIYSNLYSFVALTHGGFIQSWGDQIRGGALNKFGKSNSQDLNTMDQLYAGNITVVYSSSSSYAALKMDGSVFTWGWYKTTPTTSEIAELFNVRMIYSTFSSFAVLYHNGTLFPCGAKEGGGSTKDSNPGSQIVYFGMPADILAVKEVYAGLASFVAVCGENRTLSQVWGNSAACAIQPPSDVKGVVNVVSRSIRISSSIYGDVYAALTEDGKVVLFGATSQLYIDSLDRLLKDVTVVGIYPYTSSFLFLTDEGNLTTQHGGTMNLSGNVSDSEYAQRYAVMVANHMYSDSTAGEYYPCPPAMYGTGFPDCQPCPQPGQEHGQAGQGERVIYSVGIRSHVNSCLKCPRNSFSPDGLSCSEECASDFTYQAPTFFGSYSSGCTQCSQKGQYYNTYTKQCRYCEAGKHYILNSETGLGDCKRCEEGKYQQAVGQDKCVACADGFTSNPRGTTSENSGINCFKICRKGTYGGYGIGARCLPCGNGLHSPTPGLSICEPCPPGTTSELTSGSEKCTPCARGRYTSQYQSTECQPCEINTYTDRLGSTNCTVCTTGYTTPENLVGSDLCVFHACSPGYRYHNDTKTNIITCKRCEPGTYSADGAESSCMKCPQGKYASDSGQDECDSCEAGKYGVKIGGILEIDSCQECEKGSYSSFPGLDACELCNPGSMCPSMGMVKGVICNNGTIATRKGSSTCTACSAGTYQANDGEAVCEMCPAGTYSSAEGYAHHSSCEECPVGTYSPAPGSSECTVCSKTQFNPISGQTSCQDCQGLGKIGNVDKTSCIEDPAFSALSGPSLVESLYTRGTAFLVSFLITLVFVSVIGAMHYKKEVTNKARSQQASSESEGDDKKEKVELLAILPYFPGTALRSFLTGFSFGSELVLVVGLVINGPGCAAVIILFRCLHIVVTGTFVNILLSSGDGNHRTTAGAFTGGASSRASNLAVWLEKHRIVNNATSMRTLLDEKFCRANMPLFSVVTILSMIDCSLIQFLPWRESELYTESQGFPSLTLLRWCLGIDCLQATGSVVAQTYYLASSTSLDDATTTTQAKALFGLNISFSVMSCFAGLVMLFLKDGLLRSMDSKHQAERQEGPAGMDEIYPSRDMIPGPLGELGGVTGGGVNMLSVVNPMLTLPETSSSTDPSNNSSGGDDRDKEKGGNGDRDREMLTEAQREIARLNVVNTQQSNEIDDLKKELSRLRSQPNVEEMI